MIKKISIQNFKSLADVDVDLAPFTVLIGKNGAGKSSFLQALEVLSWLVRYSSINEQLDRKGILFNDLVFLKGKSKKISWNCEVEVEDEESNSQKTLLYEARIAKRRFVSVDLELANFKENPIFSPDTISKGHAFLGRAGKFMMASEDGDEISYGNAVLAHSLLQDVLRKRLDLHEKKIPKNLPFPFLGQLAETLFRYCHFQIWGPEKLREKSSQKLTLGISETGENLASTISFLKSQMPKVYSAFLNEMTKAYPWLDDIEIVNISRTSCSLNFLERPPGGAKRRHKYAPSQVSDGFLRLLALTTLKYQPFKRSIIGYEEPENGLHPQMLAESVAHLKDIARAGTQVIVTTHSPYLLDYLMDDAEEDSPLTALKVVIRDENDGKTKILPVSEEKLARARKQGIGAGELWGMLLNEKELT